MNDHIPASTETENKPPKAKSVPVPKALSGLGVCSIICGLFSFIFPLPALFGIGMALVGLRKDRRDLLCYIGLCLSCALLAFNLVGLVQMCSSAEMAALYGSMTSGGDIS